MQDIIFLFLIFNYICSIPNITVCTHFIHNIFFPARYFPLPCLRVQPCVPDVWVGEYEASSGLLLSLLCILRCLMFFYEMIMRRSGVLDGTLQCWQLSIEDNNKSFWEQTGLGDYLIHAII